MDIDALKAKGDAALAQISNALDDLQYSPDQRPVPLLHLAMDYVRDMLAILSARQEGAPVADEYGWVAGPPHRILSKEEGEWFIAETIHGDRVVLKGLPEEYTYDFTTADGTYWKREVIKRWRQFPDSEYKPLGVSSPAHTSEARDAVVTDAMVEAALDAQPFTEQNMSHRVWQLMSQAFTDEERRTMMRSALVAAMRQEAGDE